MARATSTTGNLLPIQDCYIRVDGTVIYMYTLPTISDSHGADYSAENGIGRAIPTQTFQNGTSRTISWDVTFISDGESKLNKNLSYLRLLQSCTYPVDSPSQASVPFLPPKILKIKCGKLLGDYELCVILKQVQINWPIDVPWSSFSYIPYKFNAGLSFEVVYNSAELPGQSRILKLGL